MTWRAIETNWQQFESLVRRHWFRITESDLAGLNGQRELLVQCIAGRYDLSAADAEREIDAWVWLVAAPVQRAGVPVPPERETPGDPGLRTNSLLRRILEVAEQG